MFDGDSEPEIDDDNDETDNNDQEQSVESSKVDSPGNSVSEDLSRITKSHLSLSESGSSSGFSSNHSTTDKKSKDNTTFTFGLKRAAQPDHIASSDEDGSIKAKLTKLDCSTNDTLDLTGDKSKSKINSDVVDASGVHDVDPSNKSGETASTDIYPIPISPLVFGQSAEVQHLPLRQIHYGAICTSADDDDNSVTSSSILSKPFDSLKNSNSSSCNVTSPDNTSALTSHSSKDMASEVMISQVPSGKRAWSDHALGIWGTTTEGGSDVTPQSSQQDITQVDQHIIHQASNHVTSQPGTNVTNQPTLAVTSQASPEWTLQDNSNWPMPFRSQHRRFIPLADPNEPEVPDISKMTRYEKFLLLKEQCNKAQPRTSAHPLWGTMMPPEFPKKPLRAHSITATAVYDATSLNSNLRGRHWVTDPVAIDWIKEGKTETQEEEDRMQFTIVSYCLDGKMKTEEEHATFMSELSMLDADIICLQDVNAKYFDRLLCSSLVHKLGYYSAHYTDYKRVHHEIGLATFYRKTHMEYRLFETPYIDYILNKEFEDITDSDSLRQQISALVASNIAVQITQLYNKHAKRTVRIANVKLFTSDISLQLACLQARVIMKETTKEGKIAGVICGELGINRYSPIYHLLNSAVLFDKTVKEFKRQRCVVVNEWQKESLYGLFEAVFHKGLTFFESAYSRLLGIEPPTRREVSGADESWKESAYIWFTYRVLGVTGILDLVTDEKREKFVHPPSLTENHVPLKAKFRFILRQR